MVETEVRRSDRIKQDNNGYRIISCDTKGCLPCNAAPLQNRVVKNLTISFWKVDEEKLQEKLYKSPKKKGHEDVVKVPKATGTTEQSKMV